MSHGQDEGEGTGIGFDTMHGRDWPSVRQYNVFVENRVGNLLSVVRRFETTDIRIVSLTAKGKALIAPIFRKHAAEIGKVFAVASPKELRSLETMLKKIGKCAERLGSGIKPRS